MRQSSRFITNLGLGHGVAPRFGPTPAVKVVVNASSRRVAHGAAESPLDSCA
jgi:hypothetical protein